MACNLSRFSLRRSRAVSYASCTILFTSASIFGVHYFRGGMKGDRLAFTASYHIGQWFVALSVWGLGLIPFN